VQGSHPAIIEPDEFDSVQAEIERRKNLGRPVSSNSPFSAKIVCGECDGYFGAKVWGSNTKYRRVIWRCNEKYEHEKPCQTPHLTEDDIKQKFLTAFNSLMGGRDELITNCRLAQTVLCDYKEIDSELDELHREIRVVTELSRKAIHDNARVAQSQDEFNERNSGYLDRYHKAKDRVSEIEDLRKARKTKNLILDGFIREIESRPLVIDEFDERLWTVAVDRVTVMVDGGLTFRFKDGSDIAG